MEFLHEIYNKRNSSFNSRSLEKISNEFTTSLDEILFDFSSRKKDFCSEEYIYPILKNIFNDICGLPSVKVIICAYRF